MATCDQSLTGYSRREPPTRNLAAFSPCLDSLSGGVAVMLFGVQAFPGLHANRLRNVRVSRASVKQTLRRTIWAWRKSATSCSMFPKFDVMRGITFILEFVSVLRCLPEG